MKKVVFTDLDGTLLDHDSYDWRPASSMLDELKDRRIPVVLVSSKTLAELEVIRHELGLPDPVVAENGAAIDVPEGYFPERASFRPESIDRATLQQHFAEIRDDFDCVSFSELGDAGIADATGLTLEQAGLANQRIASEPVLWRDTEQHLADFTKAAESRGLRCTRGGRFVHLMGPVDKADAVRGLSERYRRLWPDGKLEVIALGDGPNDLGMLRAADVAVVIRGKHGQPMPLDGHPQVLRPEEPGPKGWAQAMRRVLAGDCDD